MIKVQEKILCEAMEFHEQILQEGSKALVGYDHEKRLVNMALLTEIPTTYHDDPLKQVNSGNILLVGVPGVGKTFFGVIVGAVSNAKFARIQGRFDLQPSEIVGFDMINPATGEHETTKGPIITGEILLLDEISRIAPKSQSGFLEGLQEGTVTIGNYTYELSPFRFAIATMNPVEIGQGTQPLSEAIADRFAIQIVISYLPPEEERKLVRFDFKKVELNRLLAKERIVEIRSAISGKVFLNEKIEQYIMQLVMATRPYNPSQKWLHRSPSDLVEKFIELGASPRTTICWGRLAKTWALLERKRDVVYPDDVRELAENVLGHRLWLKPEAISENVTVAEVIKDVLRKAPTP